MENAVLRQESKPNAFAAYSLVLLRHGDRYLLLRRAETKRFAPGRWTGLGGRIEDGEFADLQRSALRELAEEAGIDATEVADFALRRALLHAKPGEPLTLLLYFTGSLSAPVLPATSEGTLSWVTAEELKGLDIIENTRLVLPLLIADLQRDPPGHETVWIGAAHYHEDGRLERIVWA
jgi:8-oxo-dGTP diphosphatase